MNEEIEKESRSEQLCQEIVDSFSDSLTWKWDGRFETALAEFSAKDKDKVKKNLSKILKNDWDKLSITIAPSIIKQIAKYFGGVRLGQHIFSSDCKASDFVFIAWWPWGNGETISLRIAIYDSLSAQSDQDKLKKAFNLN